MIALLKGKKIHVCACSQREKPGRIYNQILMTVRIDVIFILLNISFE